MKKVAFLPFFTVFLWSTFCVNAQQKPAPKSAIGYSLDPENRVVPPTTPKNVLSNSGSTQTNSDKIPSTEPNPIIERPLISAANMKRLRALEDSLNAMSEIWMFDTTSLEKRKNACYAFIPRFIMALKIDNSFYYPFDSLDHVTKIYAPDSAFRIFTWQLHYPKGRFRYYGVIQMKSEKMKIFPLRDLRDTLEYRTQAILSPDNWYGCLYYNVVKTFDNNKPVYTLFGFEAPDFVTRRKVLEVMRFDENEKPVFGAPMFQFKRDSTAAKQLDTLNRFFIEYKWDADPRMNYDSAMEVIVYNHLVPPNPKAEGAYFSYVPDGQYEGFKWLRNHWQWIARVFNFSIGEMDNPPIPAPLFGKPEKQPNLPTEIEKPQVPIEKAH